MATIGPTISHDWANVEPYDLAHTVDGGTTKLIVCIAGYQTMYLNDYSASWTRSGDATQPLTLVDGYEQLSSNGYTAIYHLDSPSAGAGIVNVVGPMGAGSQCSDGAVFICGINAMDADPGPAQDSGATDQPPHTISFTGDDGDSLGVAVCRSYGQPTKVNVDMIEQHAEQCGTSGNYYPVATLVGLGDMGWSGVAWGSVTAAKFATTPTPGGGGGMGPLAGDGGLAGPGGCAGRSGGLAG